LDTFKIGKSYPGWSTLRHEIHTNALHLMIEQNLIIQHYGRRSVYPLLEALISVIGIPTIIFATYLYRSSASSGGLINFPSFHVGEKWVKLTAVHIAVSLTAEDFSANPVAKRVTRCFGWIPVLRMIKRSELSPQRLRPIYPYLLYSTHLVQTSPSCDTALSNASILQKHHAVSPPQIDPSQ
jgi:hypothetical protein